MEINDLRRGIEDETNMQERVEEAREELKRLHASHCCLLHLQRLGESQMPQVDAETDSEGQAVTAECDDKMDLLTSQDVHNMQASVGYGPNAA